MTPSEAMRHLITSDRRYALQKCRSCLDFGTFYVFCFSSIDAPDGEMQLSGTVYPRVDKDTGRVSEYDITEDVDAYLEAKPVSIKDFWDTPISDAALKKAQEAFAGAAEELGVKDEDDVQALVDEVRRDFRSAR